MSKDPYMKGRARTVLVNRDARRLADLRTRIVGCLKADGPMSVETLRERLTVASQMQFNTALGQLVRADEIDRRDVGVRIAGDPRPWPWARRGRRARGITRMEARAARGDA
jgi:hypothetical protein